MWNDAVLLLFSISTNMQIIYFFVLHVCQCKVHIVIKCQLEPQHNIQWLPNVFITVEIFHTLSHKKHKLQRKCSRVIITFPTPIESCCWWSAIAVLLSALRTESTRPVFSKLTQFVCCINVVTSEHWTWSSAIISIKDQWVIKRRGLHHVYCMQLSLVKSRLVPCQLLRLHCKKNIHRQSLEILL